MKKTREPGVVSLREAHLTLLTALQRLDNMTRRKIPLAPGRWRSVLEPLRDDVLTHFEMEEHDGYMEGVLQRHPEWHRVVHELQEEHRRLGASLDLLIEKADTAGSQEEVFRESISTWIGQMRQHEARENTLVEDAFNLDFGAEA